VVGPGVLLGNPSLTKVFGAFKRKREHCGPQLRALQKPLPKGLRLTIRRKSNRHGVRCKRSTQKGKATDWGGGKQTKAAKI